jgi:hypothetical protein
VRQPPEEGPEPPAAGRGKQGLCQGSWIPTSVVAVPSCSSENNRVPSNSGNQALLSSPSCRGGRKLRHRAQMTCPGSQNLEKARRKSRHPDPEPGP